MTSRVAEVAQVGKGYKVLEVACGEAVTARFLARHLGCEAVGIDLSREQVFRAWEKVAKEDLSHKVDFVQGDIESLPFINSSFDIVISECSFSLLPNKEVGAGELHRVLKPGGKLVITDVVLRGEISEELRSQVTFAFCIAGAKTLEGYIELFENTGFTTYCVEDHSQELKRLAYQVISRGGWENLLHQPKEVWQRLFREGKPGYALIAMSKL